jgi:hypothetical protein
VAWKERQTIANQESLAILVFQYFYEWGVLKLTLGMTFTCSWRRPRITGYSYSHYVMVSTVLLFVHLGTFAGYIPVFNSLPR